MGIPGVATFYLLGGLLLRLQNALLAVALAVTLAVGNLLHVGLRCYLVSSALCHGVLLLRLKLGPNKSGD